MKFSTLHEAIAYTLEDVQSLTFKEIEEEILNNNLWRRPSDGKFPVVKQIKDRSLYKYPHFFKPIGNDRLQLVAQPVFPNIISRIAYNTNGWVAPSGLIGKSKTIGLHEADYGFGHEEWLFDFSKLIHGYKYGFIEGFRTKNNKHTGCIYNVQLFTIDSQKKEKYWAATIYNCYVLSNEERKNIRTVFLKNGWIDSQAEQLKEIGLDNKSSKKSLSNFFPNVMFLEKDVTFYDPLIPVASNEFIKKRDRYLIYGWDDEAKIDDRVIPFIFKPSAPSNDRKVWRKKFPEFKSIEIKQIHKKISSALYADLVIEYGKENIACDVPNGGTFIDMVREDGKEYIFYEIKTYNLLRKNIREAIGQLLEYAYWQQDKKIKGIVIVTEKLIDTEAAKYIKYLNQEFGIPISYLQRSI